jgi:hypothetical protein
MLVNLGKPMSHLLLIEAEEVDHVEPTWSLVDVSPVEIGANYRFGLIAPSHAENLDLIGPQDETAPVQLYAIVTNALIRSQLLSQC